MGMKSIAPQYRKLSIISIIFLISLVFIFALEYVGISGIIMSSVFNFSSSAFYHAFISKL